MMLDFAVRGSFPRVAADGGIAGGQNSTIVITSSLVGGVAVAGTSTGTITVSGSHAGGPTVDGAATGTITISGSYAGSVASSGYTVPTVAAVGTLVAATGAGITVGIPAGYQADDIALLFRESANESGATPTDWTALTAYGTGTAAAAAAVRIETFWQRLAGSGEADPTFAATTDHQTGVIILIRGCPTGSDPVMVQVGTAGSNGGASPRTLQGITSTLDNSLVIYALARPDDSASAHFSSFTSTELTNEAEHVDTGTTLGHGGGIGIMSGTMATAGAVAGTVTVSSVNQNFAETALVLRPTPA
jgi:hypothetical protein